MYLREHQAKAILAAHGAPTPKGGVARSGEEAEETARGLGLSRCVVKAQIAAGGRGLAGGVKAAESPARAGAIAAEMIGSRLVTEQTGAEGETVERVYVEEEIAFDTGVYVALVIDQRTALPTILGSAEGGVDFERKAREDPGRVKTLALPADGSIDGLDLKGFLGELGVAEAARASAEVVLTAMIRALFETDASLIEVNPLVITGAGEAIAVDAKMVLDGNALFRHPEHEETANNAGVEGVELVARENEINFVKMRGDIGMVVNGAGLALATHDMVIDAGGAPANFMDIRTTATSFQIARGVGLLLDDPSVKVLLVNIHGGGMTVCDTIAEAINFAYVRSERKLPIVYRAAGQNAPWALTIMRDRKLPFEKFDDMSAAVARAVEAAKGSGGAAMGRAR